MNKYKNDNEIVDYLFDKDFDLFLQENIDNEFEPDEEVKNRVKNRVIENINNNENIGLNDFYNTIHFKDNNINTDIENIGDEIKMKKNKRSKIMKIVAASIAFVLIAGNIGTYSIYGKDMFTVIKEINLKNIGMVSEKYDGDNKNISMEIPKNLKGQIFDEKGNVVKRLTPELEGKIYDKNGKKIIGFTTIEGSDKVEMQVEGQEEEGMILYNSVEEASNKLKFKPLTIPNMKVKKVYLYEDEDKNPSSEIIDIIYDNGDGEIFVQQRFASKENGYYGGAANIKKVDINGNEAIMSEDNQVDWEYKDKLIGVISHSKKFKNDELLKLCREMK